ncbi:transketolase [Afifella sp. IM 167]|uniref:transketolase n=1 Tax=Afifella sp. IM 167 TaxID=2033586 RepID=UPI001CCF3633|nr:transketolase [Afifella sp. IM 167]
MDQRSNRMSRAELAQRAAKIRRLVVEMVGRNGQGYVQQGLGAADLFTYLWFAEANLDPALPDWPERDRIFLSTAHNSAVFHATLAERGLIAADRLESYTRDGSELEINVSERLGPMVEATCGSLGQGLSVACGVALSARRHGKPHRSYVILGDGELQEGQTWEAAMFAAAKGLSNLCLIVDVNDLQVEGSTQNVVRMEPIDEKFAAFGWAVHSLDGHDFDALEEAFDAARRTTDRPSVLLARTLVGKGVPFLEGQMSHNLVFPEDVAARAMAVLEAAR